MAGIVAACSKAIRTSAKVAEVELAAPRGEPFVLGWIGMYLVLSGSEG
jgi:hypothetical protein